MVKNWLRAKTNIEFLALWEKMNNPNVKGVEIDSFKNEAGTHYFTMSPQRWIKETNAIGIVSKSGNNGGTHTDSIKSNIIPMLTENQKQYVYAN